MLANDPAGALHCYISLAFTHLPPFLYHFVSFSLLSLSLSLTFVSFSLLSLSITLYLSFSLLSLSLSLCIFLPPFSLSLSLTFFPLRASQEPMIRYQKLFPSINETIKRRETKFSEFERSREKLSRALRDKNKDPRKVDRNEAALKASQSGFEDINETLKAELPFFDSVRADYFDPCFAAMVRHQIAFRARNVAAVDRAVDAAFAEPLCDMDFEQSVRDQLDELASLSIVGGRK